MASRNSLTTGRPRAGKDTQVLDLPCTVFGDVQGKLDRVAVDGAVIGDDVAPVRVPEFLHVSGQADVRT